MKSGPGVELWKGNKLMLAIHSVHPYATKMLYLRHAMQRAVDALPRKISNEVSSFVRDIGGLERIYIGGGVNLKAPDGRLSEIVSDLVNDDILHRRDSILGTKFDIPSFLAEVDTASKGLARALTDAFPKKYEGDVRADTIRTAFGLVGLHGILRSPDKPQWALDEEMYGSVVFKNTIAVIQKDIIKPMAGQIPKK